jgi:glycosyltransferase involved in cell wall biosynthesis
MTGARRSATPGRALGGLPRLTVGLPVYNGEEFLGEALDALLGQTYRDFELIISDNASTDGTAKICRAYQERDSRIRYVRQQHNIGMVANHNFLVGEARGELFKWASHDDLYARDYLERCIAVLDEYPKAVLAHAPCILLNRAGERMHEIRYPEATAAAHAPERLRAMLFDGKGDWIYAVIRTATLRQTPLHATYHGGERTLFAELALHGPLLQLPEALYFRRDHPNRHLASRDWSVLFDPRRANRLRHPAVRLYLEYVWGYFSAIRRAPLSGDQKRQCSSILIRWLASRALPGGVPLEAPVSFRQQPVIYLSRQLAGSILSSDRGVDTEAAYHGSAGLTS